MFEGFETILADIVQPHLLRVTLNRPEVGNARNTQMGLDLLAVWERLISDPGDVRCVVLTGAGEKIFCAGGDLKQRKNMTNGEWQAQHLIFERGRDAMLDCPVPVIAAVNGHAYGGGLEAILGCDFIYAVRGAKFALPEVSLGIMPGSGGTQFLPRAVGERRAKEIIFGGRAFSAEEAFAWGLVNHVSEPGQLLADVESVGGEICANAPLSVRQAKKAVRRGMGMDIASALAFEIEAYTALVGTEDRREGVLAFNEKRKPVFKGK